MEVVQRVVEPVPGVAVEVVGGFVEQQHVGAPQQLAGQAQRDDLAAAEGAQVAVEGEVAQAEPVEPVAGELLDVPVVADGGEVPFVDVTGLHRVDGPDHVGDAQDLGGGEPGGEREGLREVAEDAVDGH